MQTTTTDQERAALSRVHAALLPVIALSPTPLSLSMILTFLTVATKEGRTVKEVSGITGVTQSATSRLLMDLSRRNKFGGVGLGLIEQRADDHDPRYMRNYLSEPGRALVRKWSAIGRSGRRRRSSLNFQVIVPLFLPLNTPQRTVGEFFIRRPIIDHMKRKLAAHNRKDGNSLNRFASRPLSKLLNGVSRQVSAADPDCEPLKSHRMLPSLTCLWTGSSTSSTLRIKNN